jgi:hypothetical protein
VKKILLALLFIGNSLFASANVGESGSKMEEWKFLLDYFKLIKSDNTEVSIISTPTWINLKTDGNTSGLGEELSAVRPDDGNYTKVKYSVSKLAIKAKVVNASTTYYTIDKTKTWNESFDLTTESSNYDTTIVDFGEADEEIVTFPKPLEIKAGSDASIVFINQFTPNKVVWESTGNIEASTTIKEDEVLSALLPEVPTKEIQIPVVYTKSGENNKTNTIKLLLDNENDLIGGYLARPLNDIALEGMDFSSGTQTGNSYDIKFQHADESSDENDYFHITGTFNCSDSTYSSLVINEVKDGGTPATAKPDNQDGYTLSTSGTITCTDINITQ